MFASLTGKVVSQNPPEIIFAVGDISYEILTPIPSFDKFKADENFTIFTHLSIKEDSHTLFGFTTIEEKQTFRELIKVNGVGPKVALAILSFLSVADLHNCIENEDDGLLAKTPGIGKKTAQKIIIELKGKIEKINLNTELPPNNNYTQAKAVLKALKFKDNECDKLLKGIDTTLDINKIVEIALKNKE